jgi:hypothetical protein
MDALELQLKKRIAKLESESAKLHETLATLITWMVGSANSPINMKEAELLLKILEDRTE